MHFKGQLSKSQPSFQPITLHLTTIKRSPLLSRCAQHLATFHLCISPLFNSHLVNYNAIFVTSCLMAKLYCY